MYNINKQLISKGFTLTELMVGLSIGIVVLTGLMSFYFRSTRIISEQQAIIKDLNQLQFIMNKITDDIKHANTVPPEMSTITKADYDSLPYMGYTYSFPYDDNVTPPTKPKASLAIFNVAITPKEYPVYPIAYSLPVYQAGSSAWFPQQEYNAERDDLPRESNVLVFYKVENNKILRIIYYTDPISKSSNKTYLTTYKLKRRVQYPPVSTGLILKDEDPNSLEYQTSKETVMISNLKYVHFTYPVLSHKLITNSSDPDYSVDDYDNDLATKLADTSLTRAEKSVLLNQYRNIIRIKVATAGPQIGDRRKTAFELSTEVTVRN
ncbi:MAG: hypothetical protein U0354_08315 [Candidatus Sericytochromatia bacterium]